jgi:beta-lactamase class A
MRQLDPLLQAAAGTWAVVLRDSAGVDRYTFNPAHILPSASLIKVALAWQFLELNAADPGPYRIAPADICDPEGSVAALAGTALPLRELARRMITESENNATNIILASLGGVEAANRWLAERGYQATCWRRPMLDMAARAAGRDNTTSAAELAQLLYRLNTTATAAAATLIGWLGEAVGTGKIEAGLPPGTPLAHKVGDLADVEHDAGIITLPTGDWYVLVVMAAQLPDAAAARAICGDISRRCWEWMRISAPQSNPGQRNI